MKLTKNSLNILKSFEKVQNIQSVADRFGTTYNIIRNNHFKHYWKSGYLVRVSKGHYIISNKGRKKIVSTKRWIEIENTILMMAMKKKTNEDIINFVLSKYKIKLSHSSVYSKIFRLRKRHNFKNRRIKDVKIPPKSDPELAELLGLIFSDGSYNNNNVCFHNTCIPLLNYFEKNMYKVFNLKNPYNRVKLSGTSELTYYSTVLSQFIISLMGRKERIPYEIKTGTKEIKRAFLRGYFSGDGSVCLSISIEPRRKKRLIFSTNVAIACKPQKIRDELVDLLESLGYNVKKDHQSLRINKNEDLKKFYNEISFIEDSKITSHSKNFQGFRKNQVLKYIVTLLRNDQKLKKLTYDCNKEMIVRYIKNKMKTF
jgi:hypothetical protein